MFIRSAFPEILLTFFVFLLVKCSAQEDRVIYTSRDYFKSEPSLRCYDCNSEYDATCGDPFNPYTIGMVNCSDQRDPEHLIDSLQHPDERLKPTVCRKIVQKVYGYKRVIRECGYIQDDHDDKECIRRAGTSGVEIYYCSCTKSLCNQGNRWNPSFFSISLGVSAISILGLLAFF